MERGTEVGWAVMDGRGKQGKMNPANVWSVLYTYGLRLYAEQEMFEGKAT